MMQLNAYAKVLMRPRNQENIRQTPNTTKFGHAPALIQVPSFKFERTVSQSFDMDKPQLT